MLLKIIARQTSSSFTRTMSSMQKKVCIVGAGPSGCVAAKILLSSGKFDVTVFEKAARIGGIWAIDKSTTNGWLNADTPTNLSKYSVSFSDFQWDTSFLGPAAENTPHVPMFPKAWQVNRYLEAYRQKYIPGKTIKLKHEVIKTERNSGPDGPRWKVTTRSPSTESVDEFDFLLLGSGFFSSPRPLGHSMLHPEVSDLQSSVRVIHSSSYRGLSDIFPHPDQVKGSTILVIGGGNSSGETTAAIAQHLSDSQYSPTTEHRFTGFKIVHVTPRPVYALPPYHSFGDDNQTFAPLDLRFYDLSKRPAGPIVAGAGRQPQAVKDMFHSTVQSIVGGDQSELGAAALIGPSAEPRNAVVVALTESYSEFVRSGLIDAVRGRVSSLQKDENGTLSAHILTADNEQVAIGEIAAVVHATGFTPASAVGFLPDNVKQLLDYDAESMRLPLILENWQTMTDKVPDLSLSGFYEGPYWGVIEMQARLTAARWLGQIEPTKNSYEEHAQLLDLRKGMQDRGADVPQYWFGDYLGYLEEMAAHLKLERNDGSFQEREGCTTPARYLSADADKEQAAAIMHDLHATWQACINQGRYVPRAAFRALQGDWKIRRVIDSALPSFPSGTLEGTASFHPRAPTADSSGKLFDFEYLYIESGTLTMSNGYSMPASRRYVYRYSEAEDQLSVWFVKPDHDLEVDYLFHNLLFSPPEEMRKAGACIAKADHLCVKDMYWTEYRLPIKGVSLPEFDTTHTVKGPSKDYVATTKFTRHPVGSR